MLFTPKGELKIIDDLKIVVEFIKLLDLIV